MSDDDILTEGGPAESRASRRGWLFAGLAVLIVGIIVAIAAIAGSSSPGDPTTSASADPTPSASTDDADPSASPSDAATPSPSTEPEGSAPAQPSPSEAPTEEPVAGGAGGVPAAGTASPAPIGETAPVTSGVTVTIGALESVAGEAQGPGDIAGPSLRFPVTVANATGAAIDLTSAVVNLYYGDDELPSSPLPGPGVTTLPGSLAPGESASAVYVFSVPAEERETLSITFDYSAETAVVLFTGAGPAA